MHQSFGAASAFRVAAVFLRSPFYFQLSPLSLASGERWAYRERLQLVSRSPQVLGGDQTIPENKTCSRRGGAFVSAGLVADVVRRSMADEGKRPVGHPRRKISPDKHLDVERRSPDRTRNRKER